MATRLEGYAQVRKALRDLGSEASRELTKGLKEAGRKELVPEARRLVARRRGRLSSSIQVFPRGKDVYFGSRKAYAPVQEFGGTIVHHGTRHTHQGDRDEQGRITYGKSRNRQWENGMRAGRKTNARGKHLIKIKPQPFIRPAIANRGDEVLDHLTDAMLSAARRTGLRAVSSRGVR